MCKKTSLIYEITVREYLHMRSKEFIHSMAEIPVLTDQQFYWKVKRFPTYSLALKY